MSDHPNWETLVHFGCEGTGVTVLGRRRPDATWELQLSSTGMTFDANDDEEWISATHPIGSLAEAFEDCRDFFGAIVPVEPVHPELRAEMCAIIEQIAPRPGDLTYELWDDRNREQWRIACGPSPSDPRAGR